MRVYVLLTVLVLLVGCSTPQTTRVIDFVDPFIGTANSATVIPGLADNFNAANVYPGAVRPWGMASISPRTTFGEQENGSLSRLPSGYYFGEEFIYGFGQLHLSGVGCPDWGNILVMPVTTQPVLNPEQVRSRYSAEKAEPGFYSVMLDDVNTALEVTATTRSTLSKYVFQEADSEVYIQFDLFHNLQPSDSAYVSIDSKTTLSGWNLSGNFCGQGTKQKVYFAAEFSKASSDQFVLSDTGMEEGKERLDPETGAAFRFDVEAGEQILLKIGISFVSIENARLNLETEQPDFDFKRIKNEAQDDWERMLSRIRVEGSSEKDKTLFYTALYRALIHPSTFNDVNGEYKAYLSSDIHTLPEDQSSYYTVLSLWDTYRNLHTLLTLVYPEVQTDILNTMVAMYKQSGWLPKWEIAGDESFVMVGDPVAPVIADSYIKGLEDFDAEAALEGLIKSATQVENNPVRPGIRRYNNQGFITQDQYNFPSTRYVWGTVATSLEYNYSDWATAQLARALNQDDIAASLETRSLGYRNFWDEETEFLRPRNSDGSWMTPFDPDTLKGSLDGDWPSGGPGYTEGNAWQYLFFVPHDLSGLKELMGEDRFLRRLNDTFEEPNRFVLFNEPDMSYPYLFNELEGEEWRSQQAVREALDFYFDLGPAGYPGNDDAGTISAWYIFSAMGFYPVTPGLTEYELVVPRFEEVTIELQPGFHDGSTFRIVSKGDVEKGYITNKKLNGAELEGYQLDHFDITKGGTLELNTEQ
ncbi:MAG: GH92 family glycosyl hydrolase [Bacteroidota bacterium]